MVDMVAALRERTKKRIKIRPVHTNRASSIGHPCTRFLVYNRTHWSEVEPHSPELQDIFDDGHMHEKQLIIDLLEAGVEIYDQQNSMGSEKILKDAMITAHLDFMLRESLTLAVPVDAKSMSDYAYDSINCVEDMMNSPKAYMQAYPGQLHIYSLARNAPYGYFLCKNKNNSKKKQIKVELDYGYAEELIQKGHEINKHIEVGTVPERIPYDHDICDWCRHKQTCNPDVPENLSLWFMDKPKFLDMVRRWESIEETGKEWKNLDKQIKDTLKGTGRMKIVLGEFLFTCKAFGENGQRWKRERLNISPVMGGMDDDLDTGTCKSCGKKLSAADSLIFTDSCEPCKLGT